MKKILLVCGTGASSGFMAKNIRKAAKKQNIEIDVIARVDSAIEDYINEIDLLLVGPHLNYMLHDLECIAEPYHVPVALIPQLSYGNLDGDAVLNLIREILKEL
ncbi:MAG: PTS sugar transporter subunit IIB [Clostridium sp.]